MNQLKHNKIHNFLLSGKISVSNSVNITSPSATFEAPQDTLFIGQNFNNSGSGSFTAPYNGIVLINSAGTGNSIDAGGSGLNHIVFNSTGGDWTLQANLTADTISFVSGAVYLGTGLNHTVNTVQSGGGGTAILYFASSSLAVSKNADFTALTNLYRDTGHLTFNGSTSQLFSPSIDSLPDITVNSTCDVTISVYDVKTPSFTLTNGTFDISTNSRGLYVQENLIINSGILNAVNGNLTAGGDITVNS